MYIKVRQYETGMKLLLKNRIGARKAFNNIVKREVRQEVKKVLANKSSSLGAEGSLEQMNKFSWNDIFHELTSSCPVFTSALVASTTPIKTKLSSAPSLSVVSAVGVISAIVTYKAKPQIYKLVQQMNAIQMWLSGCKREVSIHTLYY